MLLNKTSLAVKEAMCSDKTKGDTLKGIFVDEYNTVSTNCQVLATVEHVKGFYLADFPVDKQPIESHIEVTIPAKSIKKIEALIPVSNKHQPILNHVLLSGTDQRLELTATDLDNEQSLKVKPVDGFYPEYKKCFPASIDPESTQGFKLENLEKMVKFFKSAGIKKDAMIRFDSNGKRGAQLLATATNGETEQLCSMVIMPMRVKNTNYPD